MSGNKIALEQNRFRRISRTGRIYAREAQFRTVARVTGCRPRAGFLQRDYLSAAKVEWAKYGLQKSGLCSTETDRRSIIDRRGFTPNSHWGTFSNRTKFDFWKKLSSVQSNALQSLERTHSSRTFNSLLDAAQFCTLTNWKAGLCWSRAKLPVVRELRLATKRLTERERKLVREQKKIRGGRVSPEDCVKCCRPAE